MSTQPSANSDERLATVLWANTWGYNFIVFALLIDIMYRSLVFREAAWDLFAVLGIAGVISMAYAARHNGLNRKSVIVMAICAVVAAAVAFMVAMFDSM